MRLVPVVLALTTLVLPALPAARASAADPPLRLNEIMAGPARDWDGSGAFSSRDDDWVELKNVGPTALALEGYLITDADSIPRFALGGSLGPGERLMVFGKDSWDWERANGFPAFGLSLSNSGDAVILWQVAGGETLQVDTYAYRSHEAAADRSIGRIGDGESWELFDGLNPYTGSTPPAGNHCDPTPAALNDCGVTPVRRVSWGRVKQLYR
jgi:hypothetical protein